MEEACKENYKKDIMAVHDAMDVLSGKWKISIISSICYYNKRRFSNILNDIPGISNKMLSKELKELEMDLLISRNVLPTQPITVEYQLTDYGLTLQNIIKSLSAWGKEHRAAIIAKD
jgi:DNA-binding HxlR family transcriptional regulator